MQVLKTGTGYNKWAKILDCDHCDAILRIEENDLYLTYYFGTQITFKCCECNNKSFLDEDIIPRSIVKCIK